LTGKTLTATFTITGTATAFTYFGESQPGYDCGLPASVRLYFEGNTTGPYMYAKQWLSNPQAYTLTSLVGNTLTLTVPLDTANWTNKDFQLASVRPTLRPRSRPSARSVSRSAAAASCRPAPCRPTAPRRSS
jgi:hypothetical protein